MWFKNPNAKIMELKEEVNSLQNTLKETLQQLNAKQTVLSTGSLSFTKLYYFYHHIWSVGVVHNAPRYLNETYHLTAEDAFKDSRRNNACVSEVNVLKIGEDYFRPLANELVLVTIGESKDRMLNRYE